MGRGVYLGLVGAEGNWGGGGRSERERDVEEEQDGEGEPGRERM